MKKAFSKKNLWENLPAPIKESIGRVAGLVPPEMLLGKSFRTWVKRVAESDSWSAGQAREFELQNLRSICRLAGEKSPYYRESFSRAGFDPEQLSAFEDLEKLPLIDKQVINRHGDELLVVPKSTGGLDYVATGGSSGEPLKFLIGHDRSAVEFAHLASSWFRIGYRLSIPQAVFRGQVITSAKDGFRHSYDSLLRRHNYSNFHMDEVSMGKYLEHIRTIGPCYLHAYPSTLSMLVRYMKRRGVQPPANIQGLLVGSENVYEADRKATEALFGVRYYSWYGHSEKLVMAAECEHSPIYHVFPTYGYCELVDERGKRITTPGRSGEIVGTGFINKVMPFIRYRTGDYATYVGDYCEHCGRHQMLIENIRGHRTLEVLVASDRSLIPWTAVNIHDDTFDEVRQFQFAQSEVGKAILRVVPAEARETLNVEKIRRGVTARLQGRVAFEVEIVDEIKLTARGKSVFVDQKLDTDKIMAEG